MNLLVHRRFVFDELFIQIEKREYQAAIQNLTALIIEIISILEVIGGFVYLTPPRHVVHGHNTPTLSMKSPGIDSLQINH